MNIVELAVESAKERASHLCTDGEPELDANVERIVNKARSAAERYVSSIPAMFRSARVSDLSRTQRPDAIKKWLADTGSLTLWLAGPPGTGKTHAAYATGAEHVISGGLAAAWNVAKLLDALRPSGDGGGSEAVWNSVRTVPLLILDDISAAKPTEWAVERMLMLADTRSSELLRTVITTNWHWDTLYAAWGEPAIDRFRCRGIHVKLLGGSLREVVEL